MLEQLIEFLIYSDQLKQVERDTRIIGGTRRENSAEHSWHLCLMALLFRDESNVPVNLFTVLKMLVLHDIVQIEGADPSPYDPDQVALKAEEKRKARQVFDMLPEPMSREFYNLWEEFEEGQSPEALYARALDRLQPVIANFCAQGGSMKELNLGKEHILRRSLPIKQGSETLWKLALQLIEKADEKGYIPKPQAVG